MRLVLIAIVGALVLGAQDTSATLSGEVRDITGAAVPATTAKLILESAPGTSFSTRSDSLGKFLFGALPPGTYTLTLRQQGFRITTLNLIQIGAGEQKLLPTLRLDLPLLCGFPVAVAYLQLTSGERTYGVLSGRVVQDDVHPVGAATVKLYCTVGRICAEAKTDSNGDFILFHVSPGANYILQIGHSGFYPWQWMGFEVQGGYQARYGPMTLEHCPNGNCDPRLRPKRPLVVCE